MYDYDEPGYSKGVGDYLALFWRRKGLLIIPAVLVFAATVAVALYLPPIYQSTATILIEEPEVPPDLVRSTVTSYANERLHVIRQRVMATRNVAEILDKYKLYAELRATEPLSVAVGKFRSKTAMETVNARVINPQSGRAMSATIAFELSFDDPNPKLAQQVVNEIVTQYLSENIRERQGQASETTKFLEQEAERIAARIREYEARISEFKQEYSGRLPSQLSINMNIVSRTERDIQDTDRRIEVLQQKRDELQTQLATMSPDFAVENSSGAVTPAQRLQALRTEQSRLSAIYGAQHPDVIRLEQEIDALKRETGAGLDATMVEAELEIAEAQLSKALESYSPNHPTVIQLQASVESLKKDLEEARQSVTGAAHSDRATNPAYVQVAKQINSTLFELKLLYDQRRKLEATLNKYQERVLETPEIERAWNNLIRDHENALSLYKQTKNKQLSAELSESLEVEVKSERFTLIEPPQVPVKPEKPNRLAIIGVGFLGALAVGIGLVILRDLTDDAIYGARQLASIIGEPPLAAIPQISNRGDAIRENGIRMGWALFFFGGSAAALWTVHQYVRPLDILWYSVLQRLAL